MALMCTRAFVAAFSKILLPCHTRTGRLLQVIRVIIGSICIKTSQAVIFRLKV